MTRSPPRGSTPIHNNQMEEEGIKEVEGDGGDNNDNDDDDNDEKAVDGNEGGDDGG